MKYSRFFIDKLLLFGLLLYNFIFYFIERYIVVINYFKNVFFVVSIWILCEFGEVKRKGKKLNKNENEKGFL